MIDERPCGAAIDRMKPPEKTITFSGGFLFPKTPSPENRILGAPCGTARIGWRRLSPKRTKARQKGQRMAYRGKRRPARRAESKDGQRRINSVGGRFRRKSAKIRMRIHMHLRFSRAGGAPMPTGSRAGARFHRRPYAPYAVPLKGKRPKKVQLPKEVHKVHTALLMFAQPYSSLAFRLWQKSA